MNINKQLNYHWCVALIALMLTCSLSAQTSLQKRTGAQQTTPAQRVENRMLELNKLYSIYKNKALEFEELGLQSGTNKVYIVATEHINNYEESHRFTEFYYDIVPNDKKIDERRLYLIRFKDAQTRSVYTEDYLFDPRTGLVVYVKTNERNHNTNTTISRTLYFDKEGKTIVRMIENDTAVDYPNDVKLYQCVARARELAEIFTHL